MDVSNKIAHGLWIGEITPIVLLTLYSFTRHGHEFHLWRYDPTSETLPEGVQVCDASLIIPIEKVFKKKNQDTVNKLGKGSYGAPFSDLFRYKLLYEHGGWWVDMDVTCLKPFDFEAPYYFRSHPILPMVGSVIKCPAKSELMLRTFERTQAFCNAETEDWLLPNKILNQTVKELNLSKYIVDGHSNSDDFHKVQELMYFSTCILKEWYFIHWINEEWRTRGIPSHTFFQNTSLSKLLEAHQLQYHAKTLDNKTACLWYWNDYIRKLKQSVKRQLLGV